MLIKQSLNDLQGVSDCYLGIANSYYKLELFDQSLYIIMNWV